MTTKTPSDKQMPLVHLNGSGKDNLLQWREEAWEALDEARNALAAMFPNGRDYYPLGPEAFERAIEQHRRRQEAIQWVMDEIHAEIQHIYEVTE